MALPYWEFATWTLRDQAIRENHKDRITFRGNHVSAQYVLPLRSDHETDKQFAARVRQFRKTLPRHSDRPERIALAFEAFVRAGEKTSFAARLILEILRTAPAAKRAEYQSRGIGYAYKPIEPWTGSVRRGRRTKRKKGQMTAEERRIESIRVQASRFIRRHKHFQALFDERFSSFREALSRDAEWYAATEKVYTARVEAFEKRTGPFEWWAAMPLPAAAYLYHEQRKFAEALQYYRKAIKAARVATMHENLRAFVLYWMRVGVKLCKHAAGMIRMPPYSGPRIPDQTTPAPSPDTKIA